jgi:hypothetical protein
MTRTPACPCLKTYCAEEPEETVVMGSRLAVKRKRALSLGIKQRKQEERKAFVLMERVVHTCERRKVLPQRSKVSSQRDYGRWACD